MSRHEILAKLEKLTPGELAEVEQRIRILRVTGAPDYRDKITEANRRMDLGQKISAKELEARLEPGP